MISPRIARWLRLGLVLPCAVGGIGILIRSSVTPRHPPGSVHISSAVGPGHYLYRAEGHGTYRLWLPGEGTSHATLGDGRLVLLQRVRFGATTWRVSRPFGLRAGAGTVHVDETADSRLHTDTAPILVAGELSWPASSSPERFSVFQQGAAVRENAHTSGSRLVLLKRAGWSEPQLTAQLGAGRQLHIVLRQGEWSIRHAGSTQTAPARREPFLGLDVERWVFGTPAALPSLALEISPQHLRIFADEKLVAELDEDAEIVRIAGLEVQSVIYRTEISTTLNADSDTLSWLRTTLLAPDETVTAFLHRFIVAPELDVSIQLEPGQALVLGYESAGRYTAVRCVHEERVVLENYEDGKPVESVPVATRCDDLEVRKRPGLLSVAEGSLRPVSDLGLVGCLVDDPLECEFHVSFRIAGSREEPDPPSTHETPAARQAPTERQSPIELQDMDGA